VGVFDFVMTFAVFAVLLFYYGVPLQGASLVAIPLALLLAVAATVGAGSFIASLSVKYRDFRYIVPFSVQFLLFVTPVIYPASIVTHPVLQTVVQLNPMTGAIALFRASLTGQWPDAGTLLFSTAMAAVLLVGGLFYFRKTEAYFADLA
jgi:lipopolysaccharide transport system permease protein